MPLVGGVAWKNNFSGYRFWPAVHRREPSCVVRSSANALWQVPHSRHREIRGCFRADNPARTPTAHLHTRTQSNLEAEVMFDDVIPTALIRRPLPFAVPHSLLNRRGKTNGRRRRIGMPDTRKSESDWRLGGRNIPWQVSWKLSRPDSVDDFRERRERV